MTVISSIRSRGLSLVVLVAMGCAVGCEGGDKSASPPPPPSGTAPPAATSTDKVKGGPISNPAYDSARGAKPK
jgi:hypothetical protein